MILLSASMLDTMERCERRFAFEQSWNHRLISPTALLCRVLDDSLASNDPEPYAKDRALRMASKYDIQVSSLDAYTVAVHTGWLAGIIAYTLRKRLGKLERLATVETPEYEWKSACWTDTAGKLHRFCIVDHWSDDRLVAEVHSWMTIGELVALNRPITLHAVVVGAHRQGRRHSPWSKGLLHPSNHSLRFAARKKGEKHAGLSGAWQPVWREQYPQISTDNWLRIMELDGAVDELLWSREVKVNADDARFRQAKKDMRFLISGMAMVDESAAMRRSSCDEVGRGPCPFQSVCWSPIETSPEQLPELYVRK